MTGTDADRLSAPAALRNRDPIWEVLRNCLPAEGLMLEIASGTGEHVIHFARQSPSLRWQPSDPSLAARRSIAGWIAAENAGNIEQPLDLDAACGNWPVSRADAVVCINMLHISDWACTIGLVKGAARILGPGAPLFIYGPFRRKDHPIEPGNLAFDADLKRRDPRWGLRWLDNVAVTAGAEGFLLERVVDMPANNLSLIFRKEG